MKVYSDEPSGVIAKLQDDNARLTRELASAEDRAAEMEGRYDRLTVYYGERVKELAEARSVLKDAKDFVHICAGGGVSNTDRKFESEAAAVLARLESAVKVSP